MRVLDVWEHKTGSKVDAIRTDDYEYVGENFFIFLASKHIERQRSASYMNQHNRAAEW